MLDFYIIAVSEGNDVNKTSPSKECGISHYLHFLNYGFKLQPNACNRCHDLLMMSLSSSEVLNIKVSDNHCFISLIRP